MDFFKEKIKLLVAELKVWISSDSEVKKNFGMF